MALFLKKINFYGIFIDVSIYCSLKSFQAFRFIADKESVRVPRIVRVGLIQNSIALPTTAPFSDQKRAILEKVKPIIDAAGASGVNILCLQVGYPGQLSSCVFLLISLFGVFFFFFNIHRHTYVGSMDDAICFLYP